MASSTTLSPAIITSSKLCSGKNGVALFSNVAVAKCGRMNVRCMAASVPAPDMSKRQLMNLLLLGAISLPSVGMLYPYTYFFVPPGSLGWTRAKDALGNDIVAEEWLKTHGPDDRTLTQGLKGHPTYHLGCVVPWNKAENKFICPCHGLQYSNQGRVVRGPAPLSLALAHVDIDDGKVVFVPWVETDFRTGENPWWA